MKVSLHIYYMIYNFHSLLDLYTVDRDLGALIDEQTNTDSGFHPKCKCSHSFV